MNQAKDADMQFAGTFNNAHNSYAQFSGLINTGANIHLQATSVLNVASNSDLQINGLVNISENANVQMAGLINNASNSKIQLSGLLNNSGGQSVVQIGGLVNASGSNRALQMAGIINTSSDTTLVQVSGLVNKANVLTGMQLGVINIADTCTGIPVGLISFVTRGYHKLEVSIAENEYKCLAFRTGVKRLHTILQAGINGKGSVGLLGYGLGTSFGKTDKTLLDIDITVSKLIEESENSMQSNWHKLYLGLERRLLKNISVAGGITCNFLSCKPDSQFRSVAPYTITNSAINHNLMLTSWIGGTVSLRFF